MALKGYLEKRLSADVVQLLRRIADEAQAAAKRHDWTRNFQLCKRHDDIALEHLRGIQ